MLTPAEVASLSDADLSEHVARQVFGARRIKESKNALDAGEYRRRPWGVMMHMVRGNVALEPSSGSAALAVMEHMRKRWAETAPDAIRQLDWLIGGWGDYYSVGTHHCGASGEAFPLHDKTLRKSTSLGRALFESALLSAQEMVSSAYWEE